MNTAILTIEIDPATTLKIHQEEVSPFDHFDDAEIAETISEDAKTNIWSWFEAEVVVKVPGTDVSASAFLGCCSYANFEDFETESLNDVKVRALDELKEKAQDYLKKAEVVRSYLG